MSETRPTSEARTVEASAVGVVTGHTSRTTYDRKGVLLFPSVRFQTADGRTVEFHNKLGTNAPPRVGEEVTVLYDPERPEDAKVSLSDTFKPNPKVFLAVGAIFLTGVAFMFLFALAMILWAMTS